MNATAAEAALFDHSLVCDAFQFAEFQPHPFTSEQRQQICAQAEATLRAVATVEDSTAEDDEGKQPLVLRRIEARLELLTTLVAKLVNPTPEAGAVTLRWSAQGACFTCAAPHPVGEIGLFRTRIAAWIPEPLQLPASVFACQPTATEGHTLWLRFGPLDEVLTSALERHLFRLHRRVIAERRQMR